MCRVPILNTAGWTEEIGVNNLFHKWKEVTRARINPRSIDLWSQRLTAEPQLLTIHSIWFYVQTEHFSFDFILKYNTYHLIICLNRTLLKIKHILNIIVNYYPIVTKYSTYRHFQMNIFIFQWFRAVFWVKFLLGQGHLEEEASKCWPFRLTTRPCTRCFPTSPDQTGYLHVSIPLDFV